jgi:arsenite methyltransferase
LSLTGRAMEFCRFPVCSRLLDVGCGEGATVEYLRNHYQLHACGLDISSRLLLEGKSRYPALPILRARGEHLPFASGSLDGILCECVLSLLSKPGRALHEFNRVLGPDGMLILSDIYLRGEGAGTSAQGDENNLREKEVHGCMKGARSAGFTETLLCEAGFEILLWEDHTLLLRELAARLVLAHGSADALLEGLKDTCCFSSMAALKSGYYLLVARKV